jgi:RIP metalloprotease RseP
VVLGVVRDGRPLEVSVTPKKIDETTFIVGFKPSEEVIGDVEELSAAYAAGLRRGDFIVDTVPPKPQSVEIGWQRPDGSKHSAVIPIVQGAAALRLELIKQEPIWCGFTDVWWGAARETRRAVSMTYDVLLGLLSRRVPVGSMSGLPQIVAMTYRSAKSGMGYYLWLVAVISVNLAVINLFPMVPLDGGLLIFLLYEALRGRPANPRIQETAQLVGAMLLLVLIVYVTQNDFVRLFS